MEVVATSHLRRRTAWTVLSPAIPSSLSGPTRGLSQCQEEYGLELSGCQELESSPMDVMGVPEIARLLGVSRQRVYQLIDAYDDFPRPVARLAVGRIWSKAAVEEWNRLHGERPSGKHRRLRLQ